MALYPPERLMTREERGVSELVQHSRRKSEKINVHTFRRHKDRRDSENAVCSSISEQANQYVCLAAFHYCFNLIIIHLIFHAAISWETNNLFVSVAVKRQTTLGR